MILAPRLIAVGDVHGELDTFREILLAENLIDSSNNWIGKNAHLFQAGDMIDRGPKSLEAVALIRHLQEEAPRHDGRVIRLFGNHELMILQGYYYYCSFEHPEFLKEELREEILAGEIQAAYVREERLYTHAGVRLMLLEHIRRELGYAPDELISHYDEIADYVNEAAREGVRTNDYTHPVFWVDESRGGMDTTGGIFWAHYPDLEREDLNPLRQVVGHTPRFGSRRPLGIRWTADLKKINLDAGMYSGYGGQIAWLAVEGGSLIAKQIINGKTEEQLVE